MGIYLEIEEFPINITKKDLKEKLRNLFIISPSFINEDNEDDFKFEEMDDNGITTLHNSAFDYIFETFLRECPILLTFKDIENCVATLGDFLIQYYSEDFSDFVHTNIIHLDSMTVSIALIIHEL